MSLYQSGSQEQIFLQDLYKCLNEMLHEDLIFEIIDDIKVDLEKIKKLSEVVK